MCARIVGVVPAAGYARRLQPLDRSKEVLEVEGRPVLYYLLDRMRAGGADELRVVTRPEKQDVATRAAAFGARVVLGRPQTAAESISLGLLGLADEDIALIGFPDTVWEPEDGFRRLVAVLTSEPVEAVLGLFRTRELTRSDVVEVDHDGRVRAIAVKPSKPPSELIWGCAAARVRALSDLARFREAGELFDRLARAGGVRGLELSSAWIDIGTKKAFFAAQTGAREPESA